MALDVLSAALHAVDPGLAVRRHLSMHDDRLQIGHGAEAQRLALEPDGRIFIVGAGKAAGPMMAAAEDIVGPRNATGIGVTVPGGRVPLNHGRLYEGGHPLPNPNSLMAARHIVRTIEAAGPADIVLVLLSGGASALLEWPAGRIPLVDVAVLTSRLIGAGAPIDDMNTVRKHVSRVKGGQLLRLAAPARVVTLALSDVVGARADVIGGGPTVPDPTTFADAGAVLSHYNLWSSIPQTIGAWLHEGMAGRASETLKPSEPPPTEAIWIVVGDVATACEAAAARAEALGFQATLYATNMTGEAREVGPALVDAGLARQAGQAGQAGQVGAGALGEALSGGESSERAERSARRRSSQSGFCLVAGGETTVTRRHLGSAGGRARELALAAAIAMDGREDILLAALGTDGIDGDADAAGAISDGTSVQRARDAGRDAAADLEQHDSGSFFAALEDAIVTGPTGTNVGDIVIVLTGFADRSDAAGVDS